MKKYIVFINDDLHSAWNSLGEARKQANTLKNYSYKKVTYMCIDHEYENGHYFV